MLGKEGTKERGNRNKVREGEGTDKQGREKIEAAPS